VKAEQTSIWHSTQTATRTAEAATYAYADIARAVRLIVGLLEGLGQYVQAAGRPCIRLYYEDFATGDPATIEAACDALGLPRRRKVRPRRRRSVEKIGDEVNIAWASQFNAQVDSEVAEILAAYAASWGRLAPHAT
jgi:LPS sulfotransferase NodH